MVTRTRDKEDERRVLVDLTEAGAALRDELYIGSFFGPYRDRKEAQGRAYYEALANRIRLGRVSLDESATFHC